jgi:L-fucono-1,5-lactonase
MRIDAHQHFWQYATPRHAWIGDGMAVLRRDFLPEDLQPLLEANQIDATVAVQVCQSEDENAFLLDLAARNAWIAGIVGWVDLLAPNLPERLEYYAQFPKMRGFRHIAQSEPDDGFLAHDRFVAGVRALQPFGFTYDILIYPRQLPAALDLTSKIPGQRFVIDHIAKPLVKTREINAWSRLIREIAQNPSVSCKISGLITEADWSDWRPADFYPYLDAVFEAFGPDRLLFGSDWPVCLLAGAYGQVVQLISEYTRDFSTAVEEKVFGENSARFYGLKEIRE